ncbi:MAG: hypothetical protein ACKVS6_02790 [Planctomycetota bacterium]
MRTILWILTAGVAAAIAAGAGVFVINILTVAAFAIVVFAAKRADAPGELKSWTITRSRWLSSGVPAAIALLVSIQTLAEPYFSDDYAQLLVLEDAESPSDVFIKKNNHWPYWRPVVWLLWWIYSRVSLESAILARVVSICLFTISAALVAPALRRLGAGRGVSVISAMLWAASPIALETASWLTNQYSLAGACIGLALVAYFPVQTITRRSSWILGALATLAYLAKEDAVVWPILLFFAKPTARRIGFARRILIFLPAAAGLLIVTIIRNYAFPEIEYYKRAAGGAIWSLPEQAFSGVQAALSQEKIVSYLLPIRTFGSQFVANVYEWAPVLPFALLAFGARSRGARVGFTRGLVFAIVCAAPVLLFLPFHAEQYGARLLYQSNIGFCWMLAAVLSGISNNARIRCVAIGIIILILGGAAQWNHRSWPMVAAEVRKRIDALAPGVASAPAGSRIVIYGQPEMLHGIMAFRNTTMMALYLKTQRRDVQIATMHSGMWGEVSLAALDKILIYDERRGVVDLTRDFTDRTPPRTMGAGETIQLGNPAAMSNNERDLIFAADAELSENSDGSFTLRAKDENIGTLLFPPIGVPSGSTLQIQADARASVRGVESSYAIFAIYRRGSRLEHTILGPDLKLTLPAEASVVRFVLCVGSTGEGATQCDVRSMLVKHVN